METRINEAAMCCTSVPFLASSTMPVTTWSGVGKYGVLDRLTAHHQAAVNTATSKKGARILNLLVNPDLRGSVTADVSLIGVRFVRNGMIDDLGFQPESHQLFQFRADQRQVAVGHTVARVLQYVFE